MSLSNAGKEMQTRIDDFRKHTEKLRRREVIINYDCSGTHDPFRNRLRELLVEKWNAHPLNESLYQLSGSYSDSQVEEIKLEIKNCFEAVMTEGVYEDKGYTKVTAILPDCLEFDHLLILHKEASRYKIMLS